MCAKGASSVSLHTWLITVRSKPGWAPDSWNGEREEKRGGEEEATLHLHNLRMRRMGVSYESWPDKEGLRRGVERCERESSAVCVHLSICPSVICSWGMRHMDVDVDVVAFSLGQFSWHTATEIPKRQSHPAQELNAPFWFCFQILFCLNSRMQRAHKLPMIVTMWRLTSAYKHVVVGFQSSWTNGIIINI